MTRPFEFESFDEVAAEDLPAGPCPDYLEGFAAGQAAAAEGDAASLARLTEEALQVLTDIAFTYAEARGSILAALGPLLHALMDQLLPAMTRDSLGPQVVDALLALAEQGVDLPIELRVAPDRVTAFETLVERQAGLAIRVAGDPALGPLQAEWRAPAAASILDLGELAEAIHAGLDALLDSTERTLKHAR